MDSVVSAGLMFTSMTCSVVLPESSVITTVVVVPIEVVVWYVCPVP